ncbi:MAG: ABC transporter permease [Parasporobacterium sp.]|nr:ABC transporter permease [Parasporobacterium sp.]
MIRFIIKRILLFIPVIIGVLFIIFTINYFTPSDPVYSILGSNITQEEYQAKEKELGLDQPFLVQFFNYAGKLVTKGDMGVSYINKRPVIDQIWERAPKTLLLGLIGMCITVLIGVPAGIISATKQNSALDYSVTGVSLVFASMPNFWLGLMLMLIFSLKLKWLPASDYSTWLGWVLPCVTLGLGPLANVSRITRSSMLDVIRQDYIRTARAKGLTERKIIFRHALKNALIPVVTVIGFMLSMIMGGSAVIEGIFNFPGIGFMLMTAISQADYPLIMGTVLFISIFVCLINLLVDIVYGFIDPRIKALYVKPKAPKAERQVKAA